MKILNYRKSPNRKPQKSSVANGKEVKVELEDFSEEDFIDDDMPPEPKPSSDNLIYLHIESDQNNSIQYKDLLSYFDNNDMDERKKLRRSKHFFKKKIKDLFKDRRIAGIVSGVMLVGLPLFLGTQSSNLVYFGMYSPVHLIINTIYVIVFLFSSGLFIRLSRTKN